MTENKEKKRNSYEKNEDGGRGGQSDCEKIGGEIDDRSGKQLISGDDFKAGIRGEQRFDR